MADNRIIELPYAVRMEWEKIFFVLNWGKFEIYSSELPAITKLFLIFF